MIQRIAIGFVLFCLTQSSFADEIRPGYLEIKENSKDVFSVLWKVPAKSNKKLSLQAQLPVSCANKTQANTQFINAAYIQRWIVFCEGGLVEKSISIAGLESTSTDVILHLEFINGVSQSAQFTPTKNSYTIPTEASSLQIISTYTKFGIEHILMGVDHLLFVFALLLIVSS
ncbi:MAG: HupE/UreJ family protein, partial [Gammaproteobacteria bacterium]|nr:HupE/UreJ family protein [Gammaproteobacteria bacterium]